jgi:hypothetical protein
MRDIFVQTALLLPPAMWQCCEAAAGSRHVLQVLNLLALLVKKYKYRRCIYAGLAAAVALHVLNLLALLVWKSSYKRANTDAMYVLIEEDLKGGSLLLVLKVD